MMTARDPETVPDRLDGDPATARLGETASDGDHDAVQDDAAAGWTPTDADALRHDQDTAGDTAVPESVARLVCLSVDPGMDADVGTLMPDDAAAVRADVAAGDRVTGAAALLTCHRIEIYAATRTRADRDAAVDAARDAAGLPADVGDVHEGAHVVEHLARVAAGLESPVVGEHEIMGQVRDAVASAEEDGHLGGALGRAADAAVRAGRSCRERTAIDEGHLSYGSVVCSLVEQTLDRPPERVLLVGGGGMAETAATAARRCWDATIDVANRSATGLATEAGTDYQLDELPDAVADVDAVVAATGAPAAIVDTDDLDAATGKVPVVDLARPADVSASADELDGIELYDLDDVTARIGDRSRDRRCAIDAAEALIADAVDRFVEGERENRAEDVLRAMHRDAAATRDDAVERALRRLDGPDADPEQVIQDLASSLTGRLLAAPTDRLREAARDRDDDTIAAARRLFDLRGDER